MSYGEHATPLRVFLGLGLVTVGLLVTGGATLCALAWAIPLGELPGRPGFWQGALLVLGGVLLATHRTPRVRRPMHASRQTAA